jgi:hypothetical protein
VTSPAVLNAAGTKYGVPFIGSLSAVAITGSPGRCGLSLLGSTIKGDTLYVWLNADKSCDWNRRLLRTSSNEICKFGLTSLALTGFWNPPTVLYSKNRRAVRNSEYPQEMIWATYLSHASYGGLQGWRQLWLDEPSSSHPGPLCRLPWKLGDPARKLRTLLEILTRHSPALNVVTARANYLKHPNTNLMFFWPCIIV